MLHRSRIDALGALRHIIARGLNRHRIFKDDADRDNLLDRLGNILSETQTACLAWAKLKISLLTVSLIIKRGEQLAHRNRYSLKD
jgi:hypothetical protein